MTLEGVRFADPPFERPVLPMFAKRQSVLAATAGAPPARRSLRESMIPVGRLLKKPPGAVADDADETP